MTQLGMKWFGKIFGSAVVKRRDKPSSELTEELFEDAGDIFDTAEFWRLEKEGSRADVWSKWVSKAMRVKRT